jgi:3-hydroxyisobutyrate dehydrogenase-like beta-hydroxyacid dehydrogenase
VTNDRQIDRVLPDDGAQGRVIAARMGTLGFVGLGAMGSRMVKRLLGDGHEVRGYNRTRSRAEALVAAGMLTADSPRAAAEGALAVLSCVADTAALRAVALGPEGILAGLAPGAVWVEMSTVSPSVTRELAAAAEVRGAILLDSPVSGGVGTVEQGQLSIYVGGDAAALDRVRPYLLALGPTITRVGPVGAAVTMKVAINLAAPVQMLAFSESVLLAEKAGIDRKAAVEAVLKSVMASPMLKYRGPFVLDLPEEPWFNVSMMQKDAQLALELARELAVPLPTTAVANEILSAARSAGLAGEDFAAVFHVLAGMSGLGEQSRALPRTPCAGGQ